MWCHPHRNHSYLNSTEAIWTQEALALFSNVGPAPLKQVNDGCPPLPEVRVVLGHTEPKQSQQHKQLHAVPGCVRENTSPAAPPCPFIPPSSGSLSAWMLNRCIFIKLCLWHAAEHAQLRLLIHKCQCFLFPPVPRFRPNTTDYITVTLLDPNVHRLLQWLCGDCQKICFLYIICFCVFLTAPFIYHRILKIICCFLNKSVRNFFYLFVFYPNLFLF